LFQAVQANDLVKAKLLVARGADVNARKEGDPPLVWAVMRTPNLNPSDFQMASFLVQNGADVNVTSRSLSQYSFFFYVAENFLQSQQDLPRSQAAQFLRLMLDKGVRPGEKYLDSDILYQAVQLQSLKHAKQLLDNGANPNATLRTRGAGASTSLLAAVRTQNPDLVALLLKHGANPNAVGSIYDTSVTDKPLIQLFSDRDFPKPLSSRERKTAELLILAGADVNSRSTSSLSKSFEPIYEGLTPLIYAAFANDLTTAKFLLRHGAKPNLRDKSGKTALDWARREKKMNVIRVLKTALRY